MPRRGQRMGAHILASKFTTSRRRATPIAHLLTGKRIAEVTASMVCVDGEDCLTVTLIRFTDGTSLHLCPAADVAAGEAHVVAQVLGLTGGA